MAWFSASKNSFARLEVTNLFKNRQKTKMAMSDAQLYACRKDGPRRGNLPGQTFRSPSTNDYKDEFVLAIISHSAPIIGVNAWAVMSRTIRRAMDQGPSLFRAILMTLPVMVYKFMDTCSAPAFLV